MGVGRAIGDNSLKLRGALKRDSDYLSYDFKEETTLIMASDGLYDIHDHSEIIHLDVDTVRSDDYNDNMTMIRIDVKRK